MLSKIVKIDDSINDITDLKTNKIKWNTFNEFIIIPNVYEFTIEEKAEFKEINGKTQILSIEEIKNKLLNKRILN